MAPPRSARLAGVDAARGAALLGMMAVHVLPPVTADGAAATPHLIAGGRSAATFAVLAGVGLALVTGGSRPPSGRYWAGAAAATAVRALIIGTVGLLLGYADSGVAVILPYYAMLFLLAVPLLGLGPRVLAAVALAAAVVVPAVSFLVRDHLTAPSRDNPTVGSLIEDPAARLVELTVTGYYPALAWTAYVAAGLAAGRLPLRSPRVAAGLLGGGLALAVTASATSAVLLGPLGGRERLVAVTGRSPAELDLSLSLSQFGTTPTSTWWWLAVDAPHSGTPLNLLHTTGVALAVLGAALLLARAVRYLLSPVAAAGSMTLSLYTGHVFLLSSELLPADPTTSYAVQVLGALALAMVWRRLVGRGPLEAAVAAVAGPVRRAVSPPARRYCPAS